MPDQDLPVTASAYLDTRGRVDRYSGGVRRIPITTPSGEFTVWTKRTGNNPRIKLLLLHGGPGATHEYFEACDSFLPAAGIEYYYDQLGSAYSDQPEDPDLWELPRFVDEVDQVRIALGLGPDDVYLLGHSWGGLLGIEYALAHQENLKGLIVSSMMSSIQAYNRYASEVLMPEIDTDVLTRIKQFEADEWPDPVIRGVVEHLNPDVYIPMQGPSELGASGELVEWDRFDDLHRITVPTLTIGGQYDTMDPAHMKAMAEALPRGRYLHCPEGSHMAMYDDQERYFAGLIAFLLDVDAGRL